MSRIPRLVLLITLALVATATVAMPAEAAKRKVPFGFFGTVMPPEMSPGKVSDAAFEEQLTLMARSGVESIRFAFEWSQFEPRRGTYDFAVLDRLVAGAARHGLSVVLNPTATPRWNSPRPNSPDAFRLPPRDPGAISDTMRQLVLRYGPAGSLWTDNPTLPRVPVRQWQIWNEQTAPWYWQQRRWARGYTKLLKAAYRAIHAADRGAKVIAGSLVASRPDYAPWDAIRDLYRAGAKRFFDVVAIHPFTNHPRSARQAVRQTLEVVRRVRAQMRRRRDGRTPIILTEVTWPAAVGKVPRAALRQSAGLATTRRGQVKRLKGAYRSLARARRKLRVTQVYWYSWATQYDRQSALSVMTFRYAGLTRLRDGVFSRMPILRTYAKLAARYQGCRKSADARRCRG